MVQVSGRFAIVPSWAVDDPQLNASALRVLLALGTYSDQEGWAYPAVSTVAARINLSRQHVHNALKTLEQLGYIERTQRVRPNGSKASNLYRILFDKPPESVRMMSTTVYIPCKPQFTSKDVNHSLHPELTHANLPTENDPPISPTGGDARDPNFDRFWARYPRKVAKVAALKAWRKINPDHDTTAAILVGVECHCESDQWLRDGGQYIPHPATYLSQRRWEDEAPAASAEPKRPIPPAWL